MNHLREKSILILAGGMWHDFAGFTQVMQSLFEAQGCRLAVTDDLNVLTQLDRQGCDLLLNYTCLFKHRPGYDDHGPEKFTTDQVAGLTTWVQAGGGFLAVHASTSMGDSGPELGKLIGGVFLSHPEPFKFTVLPLFGEHPITAGIQAFQIQDEFYLQKYDPAVQIHMVAEYQNVAYPMVWSRSEGRGRVAHIAPGHFPEVWNHHVYQQLLLQTAGWLVQG
jgi:type 1 glutamine amidotransferase